MNILKKSRMALALIPALLLSGCMAVSAAAPAAPTEPEAAKAIYYMDTLPGNWSVESAQTPEKENLRSLTTVTMYESEDGQLLPGLAALPEDVTGEYAGSEPYGIPADAKRGYAFRITLREDVFWEDGKQVDAEDVLFSIRTLLESESCGENYLWLANGQAYLHGWEHPAEEIIPLREAGFASAFEAEAAGYTRFYMDLEHFWGLEAGWAPITDRQRIKDYAMNAGIDEMYVTPAYLYREYLAEGKSLDFFQSAYIGITAHRDRIFTQEDVGILKTGKQELVVISGSPVTAQTVAARLQPLCLLREELYSDDYGTAPEHYCSYGPYRIIDAGADEILLERNTYWRGDTDAYPADVISCRPR